MRQERSAYRAGQRRQTKEWRGEETDRRDDTEERKQTGERREDRQENGKETVK